MYFRLHRGQHFTRRITAQTPFASAAGHIGYVGYARGLRVITGTARIQRMEIVFSVSQDEDGGFAAECLSHDIFTQGDTWDELRSNVQEAVSAYFFDRPKPTFVRLHLVRDEVFAVA